MVKRRQQHQEGEHSNAYIWHGQGEMARCRRRRRGSPPPKQFQIRGYCQLKDILERETSIC